MSGHKVIFNQGDIGDKLYVILKGRVAVQIQSVEYGKLPVVITTLNDGDQFGELSLI
jgi:CRP-like cAMP-binding protein